MYFEFRKCILNRKSLLFVSAAIILKLIFSFVTIKNNDVTFISDEKYFIEQADIMRGDYSEENQKYITDLYDKAAQANADASILPQKLLKGEITREEYETQSLALNEILKHRDTIKELYRRYTYVREQPDERTFGYFDGWQRLFEDKAPDLLLIVVLIWLSLSAFQMEYESGTSVLLLTCKYGKARAAVIKICCCIIVSSVITLLFSLCQFLAVFSAFPIDNSLYGIQSIEAYSDYSHNMPIISMYAVMLMLRFIGSAMITALTCLISQFSSNAVTVVTVSSMTIFLPMFLVSENDLYRLPLPLSLLCGNGAVMPDNIGWSVVIFQHMTRQETLAMIILGAIITSVMSAAVILLYCKRQLVR